MVMARVTPLASSTGNGTNALVFIYTVTAGENTGDLTVTALNANGATIADASGNTLATFTNNPAGTLVIDTTAPTVTAVAITSATGIQNSTLNVGDVVIVTVTFSEAVTVTGTPQLTLNVGGTNRTANFLSGSGSASIVFTYTIQAGDNDPNGISIPANSLALNGGAIEDSAKNAATLTHSDLATVTERVRRRVIRWFRLAHLLDASAAADMLAWENSGFSIDASVRIALIDHDVPSYFQSLEHLLRYCARPPFALERLSVIRGPAGRITQVRYVLPRHKAANWVGPGRSRKSTRPGANGVVELSPFEFLDRLADLVPPPRRHRHRYHGVFAPNHKLRPVVTSLAIGNVGKRQEAATGGHTDDGRVTGGCCDATQKPRSHNTSRIAWAKLMARVGEEFPLACPACGGDIRLIAFITDPGPIRKILTHLGEPLEPPPLSPARGPPTDWGELVQIHDDRDVFQASPDELPAIDIHRL